MGALLHRAYDHALGDMRSLLVFDERGLPLGQLAHPRHVKAQDAENGHRLNIILARDREELRRIDILAINQQIKGAILLSFSGSIMK